MIDMKQNAVKRYDFCEDDPTFRIGFGPCNYSLSTCHIVWSLNLRTLVSDITSRLEILC